MIIKKKFQGTVPDNKILNTDSTSQTDTYSCDKINNMIESIEGTDIDTIPIDAVFDYYGDVPPEGYEIVERKPSLNYSTEEQIVGTWINNKPIYQRTYFVEGTFTTEIKVADNPQNLDMILNINGFAYTDADAWIPAPCCNTVTIDYQLEVFRVIEGIYVGIGKSRVLKKVYLTIQYTKTTD